MVDVYVTGDSLPALAAALDLAEVGLSVRIARARPETGAPLPARPELDESGALAALLRRLAEPVAPGGHGHPAAEPRETPPEPVELRGAKGRWSSQPAPSVFGIPAVPLSSDAAALLGGAAAFRAYLDRLKPLLTIGKTRELGPLVEGRMGRAVREVLVEPLVIERFGVGAGEVEVAAAAPGLNETLSRVGSLTGAVLAYAERHLSGETALEPAGGWDALRETLLDRLALYDVTFAEGAIRGLRPGPKGAWLIAEGEGVGAGAEARSLVVDLDRPADVLAAQGGAPFAAERDAPEAHVGEGDDGEQAGSAQRSLAALRPSGTRAHASIGIEAPAAAAGGAEGRGVPRARLGIALDAARRPWAIRLEPGGDERWRAVLSGPVEHGGDVDGETPAAEGEWEALLATVGGVPASGEQWAVERRAAPHASVAQREREVEAVRLHLERHPEIVPVGRSICGGDLSRAVAAAHERAIPLRRRLTGISG